MLWNEQDVPCEILAVTQQEIHALIEVPSNPSPFLALFIYASPVFSRRQVMWDNLANLSNLHNYPWMIIGDCNEVLTGLDKYGGRPHNTSRALAFKNCFHCDMIDIGLVGPRFTWTNLRHTGCFIQERLDRAWGN